MKILFATGNLGFLRNFEPALRLLARRGHDIHIVAERKDSVGGSKTIDLLAQDYPDRISSSYAPSRRDAPWQPLATQLRLALDYWRYLDPRYDQSPSLRARGASQAPALARRAVGVPLLRSRAGLQALRRLVQGAERAMPYPPAVEELLRRQAPDLLLLTPLLYFGSPQVEYVRAAQALGIRTVLAVGSWDHLTTKGLIHERPDHLLVWNEMQRREAAELHGIDPADVTVTGAQAYDHWFVQQPRLSRAEFCRKVGIPDDRPLLLYLCSSPFITPHEVTFVRRWIDGVRRAADPVLRGAAILIRPHPQNAEQWSAFEPSRYDAVGIWPRAGANPVDLDARADYFDSMHYSTAVVGVNTSALIESGIVGRPVFSIIAEEFSGQQEGTLHFQHLKQVNGGLLHVGETMEQHLVQLAGAVNGGPERDQINAAKSRAFVEAFIRPHGLAAPAAERFVAAVEAQAAAPRPSPSTVPLSVGVRRALLLPMAAAARAAVRRRQARRPPAPVALAGRPLQIMFIVASPEYLRYYDSTFRLLADRGHHVVVAVNWLRERKHARLDLIEDARIEIAGVVPKRLDYWTALARSVRGTMDFARYLHPHFAEAPLLRDRMYRRVLPAMLRPLNRIRSLRPASVGRLLRGLQAVERAIPLSGRVAAFLESHRPDVVLVSPLIDAASDQVDTVRVARHLGIPVIAGIASWDNLTNKGYMRVAPDLVTVWNRHQKTEAVELHGMPAEKVVVTGAQLFDRWFERQPTMTRQEFCAQAGLPDDRPFVLFTGSSVFIARSEFEVPFVRRWIEAMRASAQPLLRDAAVLVRPHPFNSDSWIPADFTDLGPTAIWPRAKYTPASEDARASFFNSLYFCDAVVGINTSAMIEAAILRKPVLSMLTPDFAGTQEGTLHFRYLLPENGGFLRVAASIEEHLPQLDAVLRDPALTRQQTENFVATFLRPHGLAEPCTPILADTIARLGAGGPRPPQRETAGTRVLRVLIWPLAVLAWFLNLGGDIRGVAWRAAYESFDWMRRRTRRFIRQFPLAAKRAVVLPARRLGRGGTHGLRFVQRAGRAARRAMRVGWTRLIRTLRQLAQGGARAARGVGRWPRRALSMGRLLRYTIAVRVMRRPPTDAERTDT